MKKLLFIFLLIASCVKAQMLYNPFTIGPNARNLQASRGFAVPDSFIAQGPIFISSTLQLGASGDSLLSIDPSTNQLMLRPQSSSSASPDTSAGKAKVIGWSGGVAIADTFVDSLADALPLIDSGVVIVFPGEYLVGTNLAKDNVDWIYLPGANITGTTYTALYQLDGIAHDFILLGNGSYNLLGSFLSRTTGPPINIEAQFNSARSRGDTCISFPRIIDTLMAVNINGHSVYCDSFPANFYGYTQQRYFSYDVDSTASQLKSAFRWDIDNDGGYHSFLSVISVRGRIFQTATATEYTTWFGYVGSTSATTFARPILYNVERTASPVNGRAFNMTNVDIEYTLEGHGTIDGSINLSGGNGEHELYFNIDNFNFMNVTGFKFDFFGQIYGIEGGSTINLNGGGGGMSTTNFFGFVRKAVINSGTNTRTTFWSDMTKIGMNVAGNVIMNGYLRDTSGVIVQNGGDYLVNGIHRGDSYYAPAIEVQAGAILELGGASVIIQRSTGAATFKTPIVFSSGSGTSSMLLNGARIYAVAGGACYSVASGHTVNVQNLNCAFSNLPASVSGTVNSVITNGCAATNGVYDDTDLSTPPY